MQEFNDERSYTVLIGNSDDKLTQREWTEFCYEVRFAVESYANEIWGFFFTAPTDTRQSFSTSFSISPRALMSLTRALDTHRKKYRQESIAIIEGKSWFISD